MGNVIRELNEVEILRLDTVGRGVTKFQGKTALVENALPGEVVDAKVVRKHKGKLLARATQVHKTSKFRVDPFCQHFDNCGGCKWQHISYERQLQQKTLFVEQAFEKLEGIPMPAMKPILAAEPTQGYRNKMEFSFSNKRWLTLDEIRSGEEITDLTGLGLHPAGAFDKVLDLKECYLQPEPSNSIRLAAKKYADEQGLTFFDQREQEGFLRNLTIRNTSKGEVLIILSVHYEDKEAREGFLNHLMEQFPQITSVFYVINDTRNDMITDLPIIHYAGNDHMEEWLGDVKFKVGPISFFQTNTKQAKNLYDIAVGMAKLTGEEVVYDLYTGLGSIALYMAHKCKSVTGIEYIEPAIVNAKENAVLNGIDNCEFIAADMKDILTPEYFAARPKPDVIVTDPPRAGMHPKVVKALLSVEAPRIVYVSCNPVTQADDLLALSEKYKIVDIQPVDMFPQTYHVENVVCLELK